MKGLILIAALLASGCAALPNSISPEFEHLSHATQHFGDNRTDYGSNIANLTAEWDVGKHFYVTLAEGVNLNKQWTQLNANSPSYHGYGETVGPREQFTGRIGYKFIVKGAK